MEMRRVDTLSIFINLKVNKYQFANTFNTPKQTLHDVSKLLECNLPMVTGYFPA